MAPKQRWLAGAVAPQKLRRVAIADPRELGEAAAADRLRMALLAPGWEVLPVTTTPEQPQQWPADDFVPTEELVRRQGVHPITSVEDLLPKTVLTSAAVKIRRAVLAIRSREWSSRMLRISTSVSSARR